MKPTIGGPELARRRGRSVEWLHKRVGKAEAAALAVKAGVPGAKPDNFPMPLRRESKRAPREWNRAAVLKWLREEGLPQPDDDTPPATLQAAGQISAPTQPAWAIAAPAKALPETHTTRTIPCFVDTQSDADGREWTTPFSIAYLKAIALAEREGEPVLVKARCDHLTCLPRVVIPRKGQPPDVRGVPVGFKIQLSKH